MSYIKVYEEHTPEYEALKTVAGLLNKFTKHNYHYEIKTIYFDFGQNWWWTTMVVYHGSTYGSYQISPAEQQAIIECDTPEKLSAVLNHYLDKEQ